MIEHLNNGRGRRFEYRLSVCVCVCFVVPRLHSGERMVHSLRFKKLVFCIITKDKYWISI